MAVNTYLGDLTGGSLLIAESRIVATCLRTHPSDTDWQKLIQHDNILQKASRHTAKRYARTLRNRLAYLDDAGLELLTGTSDPIARQLLFSVFLLHSPVVVDFLRGPVTEARHTYQTQLSREVWSVFFAERQRAYPALQVYAASTIAKMGMSVIRALVEAGYLNNSKQRQLQPVYVALPVQHWLRQHAREDLIQLMECTL